VVVASLAVGGVLLLAMIAASGRGAVTLGADARVPIHFGSVEHCYWASKRVGLVVWPLAGAVVFGGLGGVAASGVASGWVPGVRVVIVPAVVGVLFGFQVGALVLAARGPGSVVVPEGGAGAGSGTTARSD